MTLSTSTPPYLKYSQQGPDLSDKNHSIARSLSGECEHHIDLPHYGRNIGQGQYGAIKPVTGYLTPRRQTKTHLVAKSGNYRDSLRREFEAAYFLKENGLNTSPYICSPIGMLAQKQDQPAIIMPRNIIDLSALTGDIKFEQFLQNHYGDISKMIAHDIYQGTLELLNGKNIIHHNDVKTDNIMLGADGYFKHIDFGLATQSDAKNIALKDYRYFLDKDSGFDHSAIAKRILQARENEDDGMIRLNPIFLILISTNDKKSELFSACKDIYYQEKKLAIFHALDNARGKLPEHASRYVREASREYSYYLLNEELPKQMEKMAQEIKSKFQDLRNKFPELKDNPVPCERRRDYVQMILDIMQKPGAR